MLPSAMNERLNQDVERACEGVATDALSIGFYVLEVPREHMFTG